MGTSHGTMCAILSYRLFILPFTANFLSFHTGPKFPRDGCAARDYNINTGKCKYILHYFL